MSAEKKAEVLRLRDFNLCDRGVGIRNVKGKRNHEPS